MKGNKSTWNKAQGKCINFKQGFKKDEIILESCHILLSSGVSQPGELLGSLQYGSKHFCIFCLMAKN